MDTEKKVGLFERRLVSVENGFRYVSLALIFIIMSLGFIDVVGRYFFNSPIVGAKEFVVSMLPIITGCALAKTQYDRGHVSVELLYEKFPPLMKKIIDLFSKVISLFIWIIIAYQTLIIGNQFMETGRFIEIIRLPRGYLQYAVFVGCVLLCIQIAHELIKMLMKTKESKEAAA